MSLPRTLDQEYAAFLTAHGVSIEGLMPSVSEIEDGIAHAQRNDVADGLRPSTYSRVRSVKTPNDLYQYFSAEIRRAVAVSPSSAFIAKHTNTYTGLFPTRSVNAQAREASQGCLILLHSGLLGFLQQFIAIVLRNDSVQERLFRPDVTLVQSERLSRSEVINMLRDLVVYFLSGRNTERDLRALIPVGGHMGMLYQLLKIECTQFVLCHEHAHVALGHLRGHPTMVARTTALGPVEFVEKSLQQELEADYYGAYLQMFIHYLAIGDNPGAFVDNAKLVYAAIGLFFCIDGLITMSCDELAARSGHPVPIIRDHPPSAQRLSEAKRYFIECQANDALFGMYDRIVEPIIDIQRDVARAVSHVGW